MRDGSLFLFLPLTHSPSFTCSLSHTHTHTSFLALSPSLVIPAAHSFLLTLQPLSLLLSHSLWLFSLVTSRSVSLPYLLSHTRTCSLSPSHSFSLSLTVSRCLCRTLCPSLILSSLPHSLSISAVLFSPSLHPSLTRPVSRSLTSPLKRDRPYEENRIMHEREMMSETVRQ